MSDLYDWAKEECRLACKKENPNWQPGSDFDYGCECYESALRAFKSLLDDGHSGFSFQMTRAILIRLMNGQPLTPIEDTPDVWHLNYEDEDEASYQCKRCSSLFKVVKKDGSVLYHDVDRGVCADVNAPDEWYGYGWFDRWLDEFDPVTMPYTGDKKYRAIIDDSGDTPKILHLFLNGMEIEVKENEQIGTSKET